jgi:hypothetical protein
MSEFIKLMSDSKGLYSVKLNSKKSKLFAKDVKMPGGEVIFLREIIVFALSKASNIYMASVCFGDNRPLLLLLFLLQWRSILYRALGSSYEVY